MIEPARPDRASGAGGVPAGDDTVVEELVRRVAGAEPAAVARAISICERGGERAAALLRALPRGGAHVVGITGAPGTGKSTLVSALVRRCREEGRSVGVIAVDPTSPISGGALLADRVRLDGIRAGDRNVFFRSLGSRGAAGGLSDAARSATRVLGAAGFDVVLLETVGAGQAEVRVMRVADTVVVVLIPGAGDEMQALKAGIMEIADVFDLNKADLPGADHVRRHVKSMLRTREHDRGWVPPVVETVADQGQGVKALLEAIAAHRRHLAAGSGEDRSALAVRDETLRLARRRFDRALELSSAAVLDGLATGEADEQEAARRLAREAARRLLDDL